MRIHIYLTSMLLFVFLLGCNANGTATSKETVQEKDKDTLTLAIGGEPEEGFDPTTGWGRYGSPLFQSTLLTRDQDLNITTDLATDYQISEDGITWTVQIREDAKFSDGESLTAEDIVFTFETAAQAQSVVDLTNLKKVEKTNPYEVQFHLKAPQSTFASTLQSLGIVPKHEYSSEYSRNPIGSGPYELVEWRKGEQLIVKKNPHYYGKEPEFEQITFLFLDEDQAIAAAQSGQLDMLSVPATYTGADIDGMDRLSFSSVDNRGVMLPYPEPYEGKNGEQIGHAVTSDPAIRHAMNVAIDREALVEGVLNGEGTPAYSSVDGLPWWNEETVIEDADTERAEQMLEDAGWQRAEDGIFEKEGLKAAFTLYYPSGDQLRQSLSLVFAEMMKDFGIEVSTEGKSWSEIERLMFSNPVMMGWGSHDPIELYYLYSSAMKGQGYYNSNYYENKVVDQYFEKAIHARTEEEANQYWQKAQWDGETGLSTLGDAPWVWLVNLNHVYYVHESLDIGKQKVQPHGHGWPITDFITEWEWKEGTD
ncbi:ABC transporter substrate-binding protein [Gracilibacillus sp. YIM 98692]|uniref:ABC transporter substrate-binding protein n=1 Tax=Gracilibacillus sp. YIM 98692 TaxID=2663532 RepID=UPI0013D375D1|nr:ABC transporter substrate-binding protein [Gracilibacillus sp. YIM 98692]